MKKYSIYLLLVFSVFLSIINNQINAQTINDAQFNNWNNLGGNKTNSKIIYSKTPTTKSEMDIKKISGFYKDALIIDDYIYVTQGLQGQQGTLYKMNLKGEVLASIKLSDQLGFSTRMTYDGDSTIFINLYQKVEAVDIKSNKSLWVSEGSSKQMLSQLIYHQGYLYAGASVNPSSGKNPSHGFYFAIDVKRGALKNGVKQYAWTWGKDSNVKDKGFYWDGAAIVKDSIVFVGDGGYVVSHHLTKEIVLDEYQLKDFNPQSSDLHKVRSLVYYDRLNDYLLIGTQTSKKIFKIPYQKNTHLFDKNNIQMVSNVDEISGGINVSDNGMLYVSSGGIYGNSFALYEEKTLNRKYATQEFTTQSFPLINASLADNIEYSYFLDYKSGDLVVGSLRNNQDFTFEKIPLEQGSKGSVPNNSGSVIASSNGTLVITKNDGGNLYIITNKNENTYNKNELDNIIKNSKNVDQINYYDKEKIYHLQNYGQQNNYQNTNLTDLTNKIKQLENEKINKLITDIDALNKEDNNFSILLEKALIDYGLLYEDDQLKITNYQKLLDFKNGSDAVQSKELEQRINNLPKDINLDYESEINNIYNIYQSLNEASQQLVSNYEQFLVKYQKMIALRKEVDSINQEIKNLPSKITINDFNKMNNLKTRYQKLSTVDKKYIEGYNYLLDNLKSLDGSLSNVKSGNTTYYYKFMNGKWFNYRSIQIINKNGIKKTTQNNYTYAANRLKTTKTPKSGALLKSQKITHVKKYRVIFEKTINYNINEKLLNSSELKINKNNHLVQVSKEIRTYHPNNKTIKFRQVDKRALNTNKYQTRNKMQYNKNGVKVNSITLKYNRKGKVNQRVEYQYNKKGELRSNKNGTAFRYVTSYSSNGKAKKTLKAKYNAKQRLGKSIKVKIRNKF